MFVFLFFASFYESLVDSFLRIVCSSDWCIWFLFLRWRSCLIFTNNIYAQIGLITLIGLSAKNVQLWVYATCWHGPDHCCYTWRRSSFGCAPFWWHRCLHLRCRWLLPEGQAEARNHQWLWRWHDCRQFAGWHLLCPYWFAAITQLVGKRIKDVEDWPIWKQKNSKWNHYDYIPIRTQLIWPSQANGEGIGCRGRLGRLSVRKS